MICAIITDTGTAEPNQRCIEPDPDHRGPHWSHAEPVPESCQCYIQCTCGSE